MPDVESLLTGLNDSQREAALALRGPVAIVAGAGTGKTTTITHRIACQVRSGAFDASQILAVTFTEKAAGELKRRLDALGVAGVEARTFHSAALSQLSRLWSSHTGEPLPEVLDHKAPLIASLANALPPPHKFLPRRELAGEIEWAKNRMIPSDRYLAEIGDHTPPIPEDPMVRISDGYERRKSAMGRLDFEDMLGLALRLFDEHPEAAEPSVLRFSAFTVDEFQDVNPLQAGAARGGGSALATTSASWATTIRRSTRSRAPPPSICWASPDDSSTRRWSVSRRTTAPRRKCSTSRIVSVPRRAGSRRHSARRSPPVLPRSRVPNRTKRAEVSAIVEAVRRLHHEEGVPPEEIAVLSRINARSEPFEEAFAAAAYPVSGSRRCVPAATRPAWPPLNGFEANEARASPVLDAVEGHHRRSSATTPTHRPTPSTRSRANPTSRACAPWRRSSCAPIRPTTSRPSWPSWPTGSPLSTTAVA